MKGIEYVGVERPLDYYLVDRVMGRGETDLLA
jgi:hypothetical protein